MCLKKKKQLLNGTTEAVGDIKLHHAEQENSSTHYFALQPYCVYTRAPAV